MTMHRGCLAALGASGSNRITCLTAGLQQQHRYFMDDAWYHTRSTCRSKQPPFILKARNFWVALPIELVGHCNDHDTQTEMFWEQEFPSMSFYRDLMPFE
jgi:hypothetical protein